MATAELTPMTAAHLQDLVELEESYWWHVSKRRLVVDLLKRFAPPPGVVVEGGIGSSRNLQEFQAMGYEPQGFDVMAEAVALAESRGLTAAQHDLEQTWPVAVGSCQAVILLDVIEHTQDPIAVLHHARNVLGPTGRVILTVPAYPSLYSEWDHLLGHYRRYTRAELRREATAAGLSVEWLSNWNSVSLPPALLLRHWEKWKKGRREAEFPRVSTLANGMLTAALSAERRLLRWVTVPCGLSLVAVLKPASTP